MEEGIAGSSFGLNVARLARIPPSVVQRAAQKACEMSSKCRYAAVYCLALSKHGWLVMYTQLNSISASFVQQNKFGYRSATYFGLCTIVAS